MQALTAGLAFGITMFVLATVVSALVETLHRLVGLREKGLAILLGNFYDRVIATRATDIVRGGEDRRRFIDLMTRNRGPVGGVRMPAWLAGLLRLDRIGDARFLNWIWSGRRLGALDATAFMERLGSSDYGASLMTQASAAGEAGTEWLLKDIAQKFEAYGQEASQYFESRARLLSVLVGFVFAFAINVNALVLFETYITRPDVAEAVIAQREQIEQNVQTFETRIAELNAAIDRAQQVAADPAAQVDTAALQQQVADTRAAMDAARTAAQASIGTLTQSGVPIGWRNFSEFRQALATLKGWTGLLLGGLLIGLGAPFWYKVIQNLTAVRSMAGGRDVDRGAGNTVAARLPAGPTQPPGTPIEAFHAALGATLAAGEICPPEEAVG